MPTPWDTPIKNSKQLTVFPGPDLIKASAWGTALFTRTLAEFNKLSSANKLGVTLIASASPPAKQGSGGANVQIEVELTPGPHKFTVDGKEHTDSLDPPPNIVGVTHAVGQGGVLLRAFIFVPINPTTGGGPGARGIGSGLKVALLLHELCHACGLDESDPGHSTGLNDPDLFMTGAQPDFNFPPDGVPGDRLRLGFGRFVPPFFITARTAGLIRGNWR